MSQEELAEKVNISVTHMSHIETGNTKLSLQVLVDISRTLQVSVDELLSIENNEDNKYSQIITLVKDCNTKQLEVICRVVKAIKNTTSKYL